MRVVHWTQPTTAGVAVVVHRLALTQVARGHEVVVVCPPESDLARQLDKAGVKVVPWLASRKLGVNVLPELIRGWVLARRLSADVYHLHSAKAGLVGRLVLRKRSPTVFQPHAWSFNAVTGTTRRLARLWERFAARWTSCTIAVSDDEVSQGAAAGVVGTVRTIPNGLIVDDFLPVSKAAARKELGLADKPTVLCLGRICEQKGQDVLPEIWSEVRAREPRAELLIVGDVESVDLAHQLKVAGLQIEPMREGAQVWLSAADVVILPSRWEAGLPLVALESLALVRPVVCADFEGAEELPTSTSRVVKVSEFGSAILEFLENPKRAEEAAQKGREWVVENRSWDRIYSRFEAVYDYVLVN